MLQIPSATKIAFLPALAGIAARVGPALASPAAGNALMAASIGSQFIPPPAPPTPKPPKRPKGATNFQTPTDVITPPGMVTTAAAVAPAPIPMAVCETGSRGAAAPEIKAPAKPTAPKAIATTPVIKAATKSPFTPITTAAPLNPKPTQGKVKMKLAAEALAPEVRKIAGLLDSSMRVLETAGNVITPAIMVAQGGLMAKDLLDQSSAASIEQENRHKALRQIGVDPDTLQPMSIGAGLKQAMITEDQIHLPKFIRPLLGAKENIMLPGASPQSAEQPDTLPLAHIP